MGNRDDDRTERHLEAVQARRSAAEAKYLDRIEKREATANAMVGELNSGKLYIYPAGGSYHEGTRQELIAFLLRNRYV